MTEKPFAITLEIGSSLANKTGSWRVERPVYVDRLPPCNNACPAGENIQQWLYLAEDGSYEAAWRQIMRDNPLPRRHGTGLLPPLPDGLQPGRRGRDGGDQRHGAVPGRPGAARGLVAGPAGTATGRRVLVVGSGPGGLSAAYHLRLLGHEVVIYESSPLPGGMMRYGIPVLPPAP